MESEADDDRVLGEKRKLTSSLQTLLLALNCANLLAIAPTSLFT